MIGGDGGKLTTFAEFEVLALPTLIYQVAVQQLQSDGTNLLEDLDTELVDAAMELCTLAAVGGKASGGELALWLWWP